MMKTRIRVALAAVLAVLTLTGAPAVAADPAPWGPWQTEAGKDHPLVGKIYSIRDRDFISPEKLIADLAEAKFVLIGEKHDNPDHHRLQAWILERSAQPGDAVVFEMVPEALRNDLSAAWQDGVTVDALSDVLKWEERGWYDWAMYAPVFEAARKTGAVPVPGDADRDMQRAARTESFDDLVGYRRAIDMALSQPMPNRFLTELQKAIVDGHCGMIERKDTDPFIKVQRLRDGFMADGLAKAAEAGSRGFLIAGNGHIRRDYAVPWYLRLRRFSAEEVVSLSIFEVNDEDTSPRHYFDISGMGAPNLDYVWFTPRLDDSDPCEKFAEHLNSLKTTE